VATAAGVAGVAHVAVDGVTPGAGLMGVLGPVMAVVVAVGVLVTRSRPTVVRAALALVAIQLVLWVWFRRGVLDHAVLITRLPFWTDRAVTGLALAWGLALAVWLVADEIDRRRRQDRAAPGGVGAPGRFGGSGG
jgi:hypothetical protein